MQQKSISFCHLQWSMSFFQFQGSRILLVNSRHAGEYHILILHENSKPHLYFTSASTVIRLTVAVVYMMFLKLINRIYRLQCFHISGRHILGSGIVLLYMELQLFSARKSQYPVPPSRITLWTFLHDQRVHSGNIRFAGQLEENCTLILQEDSKFHSSRFVRASTVVTFHDCCLNDNSEVDQQLVQKDGETGLSLRRGTRF